jgi:hypothetical protein
LSEGGVVIKKYVKVNCFIVYCEDFTHVIVSRSAVAYRRWLQYHVDDAVEVVAGDFEFVHEKSQKILQSSPALWKYGGELKLEVESLQQKITQ